MSAIGGLGVALVGGRGARRATSSPTVGVSATSCPPTACPTTSAGAGEALADRSLEAFGVEEGETILVGPRPIAGHRRRVRRRHQLPPAGRPVGASPTTWREVQNATRPDAGARRHRSRCWWSRATVPTRRPRRRHRRRPPTARRRRSPRTRRCCRCPASEQQTAPSRDHLLDAGRRPRRGRPVLRSAHPRAHRPLRRAEGHRRLDARSCSPAWCSRRWWSPWSRSLVGGALAWLLDAGAARRRSRSRSTPAAPCSRPSSASSSGRVLGSRDLAAPGHPDRPRLGHRQRVMNLIGGTHP